MWQTSKKQYLAERIFTYSVFITSFYKKLVRDELEYIVEIFRKHYMMGRTIFRIIFIYYCYTWREIYVLSLLTCLCLRFLLRCVALTVFKFLFLIFCYYHFTVIYVLFCPTSLWSIVSFVMNCFLIYMLIFWKYSLVL